MPRKRRPRNIKSQGDHSGDDDPDYKIFNSIYIYFATAFNLSMIFYFGFRTLIPTIILIVLYIALPFVAYFVFRKKYILKPALKAYCFVPTTLSILLSLNYFLSFNPIRESYRFSRNSETVTTTSIFSTRSQMTSLITLENNAYDKYFGIRVFLSQEDIKPSNKITFTFRTGLLGLRVLTEYQFI